MNSKKLKTSLVFFGTGQVSLKTIEAIQDHFCIEAVITKPDLVTSTGKTRPAELKVWAIQQNIQCFTPSNKAELSQLIAKHKFKSQVGLVVDYGIIIPQDVIDSFKLGILNSHFSLLPKLRGADPITFAILEGLEETGVSIMQIVAGLDEGDIVAQENYQLPNDITTPQLTGDLIELSNKLLIKTIPEYIAGKIELRPQQGNPTYSRRLTKQDGQMDPSKTAEQLEREVRAYTGWPKSYFDWQGKTYIIHKAEVSEQIAEVGQLVTHNKKLYYGCKDDSLEILEIQPANKPKMNAEAFINGYL